MSKKDEFVRKLNAELKLKLTRHAIRTPYSCGTMGL